MDPTRAKVDAAPTATFRTEVGNNSAVYKYAMANVIDIKNFPIIAIVTGAQI